MTTLGMTQATGASHPAGMGAARTVIGRYASAIRRRMEIARSERHMHSLPDHMLKDIGIHRSEISAIARFGRVEYGG